MPGYCILYRKDTESIDHLFYSCSVWKNLLFVLLEQYHLTPPHQSDNISSFLDSWTVSFSKFFGYCYLPFLAMWTLWKARNSSIFDGKSITVISLLHQISYSSQLYHPSAIRAKKTRDIGPGPSLTYPCGFFYGAFVDSTGGVGFYLHLNETHSYEFVLGAGLSTNTRVELIGLWALLHTSQMMGLPKIQIFGDSSVIINWAKGTASLSPPNLTHWCRDITKICSCFLELSFCHVYREHNQTADCLSKKSLSLAPGSRFYSEFYEGHLISQDSFMLF